MTTIIIFKLSNIVLMTFYFTLEIYKVNISSYLFTTLNLVVVVLIHTYSHIFRVSSSSLTIKFVCSVTSKSYRSYKKMALAGLAIIRKQ